MYGVEASLTLNLFFVLAVFLVLMSAFNAIMRKWLHVEKPKPFSRTAVNALHNTIDWGIRIFFLVLMMVGYFINVTRLPQEPYLFLETWFLLIVLMLATGIVQAVMEYKYAKNPNAYLYTISQLSFIVVFLVFLLGTDFWGML